ncbi:MAG: hypothetical protein COZ15_01230 [Elusimicrobia bacterium CG_4_10_14_3_um_filter_49_12_50_7]|nr:MAG: hypothetical protein COS41_05215 [Elusimicrobia bacterium CG03_land_8_20_14_0_80_50_18]PIX16703.1 MAG: hypothetical protein COZ72_00190 [Elusimicrobia bacterium CG_4_8_14_3_um_filter_50_9]PIY18048.1 MAG: hypothetical protein COZ15_01230 [Elusimicrobia bacterium CG_4_10_14_3_um_filter_49_12_50_7]
MVEYSEFKGNQMIVLKKDENDRFPFTFGISKAKKIVENFDAIKSWVKKMEAEKPAKGEPAAG